MPTDHEQYVAINRHLMTSREMADELGVSMILIRNILQKNKWSAISASDRIREYLAEHPDADPKQVAVKFNRSVEQVYILIKELTQKGWKPVERIEAPEQPGPLSERAKEWREWAADEGYGVTLKPREDRLKEAYTQSGSPFGFADKLRKIKTKP